MGKFIVAAGIILGVIAATVAELTGSTIIRSIVDFFMGTMLT